MIASAPSVVSVGMSPTHSFSKPVVLTIELVAGLGVRGDAHAGATVNHRSRVARDPSQPNLRQVHLVHRELFVELTGLRNPCAQLDDGTVRPGDAVRIDLPPPPYRPLERV